MNMCTIKDACTMCMGRLKSSPSPLALSSPRHFLQALLISSLLLLSCGVVADPVEQGKAVFAKCQACHSVDKDVNKVGPSLYGIFGRKSGTLASFPRYTESMKVADITWNGETITAFLKAPRTYVPNTMMFFAGLSDEQEIQSLLAYLEAVAGSE